LGNGALLPIMSAASESNGYINVNQSSSCLFPQMSLRWNVYDCNTKARQCWSQCYVSVVDIVRGCYKGEFGVDQHKYGCSYQAGSTYCFCEGELCNNGPAPHWVHCQGLHQKWRVQHNFHTVHSTSRWHVWWLVLLTIVYLMCVLFFTLPWAYNKDDDDDYKWEYDNSLTDHICIYSIMQYAE